MQNNRAMSLFLETLKSEETRKIYLFYLGKFVQYYKLRNIPSITTIDPKPLQIMVKDYVSYDSEAKEQIPDWIKNNACWWSEGKISDDDFSKGLE